MLGGAKYSQWGEHNVLGGGGGGTNGKDPKNQRKCAKKVD